MSSLYLKQEKEANDYFSRTLYFTYGNLGDPARLFGWHGTAGFVRDAQKSVHGAQEKAVGWPNTAGLRLQANTVRKIQKLTRPASTEIEGKISHFEKNIVCNDAKSAL